jgi:hypothetical protein
MTIRELPVFVYPLEERRLSALKSALKLVLLLAEDVLTNPFLRLVVPTTSML